ncbi:hypothetical protein Ddc_21619 [Ditylenchus destructor]|nr:hypothetical protein Ddc_21619 [Ditylenchus destructor]
MTEVDDFFNCGHSCCAEDEDLDIFTSDAETDVESDDESLILSAYEDGVPKSTEQLPSQYVLRSSGMASGMGTALSVVAGSSRTPTQGEAKKRAQSEAKKRSAEESPAKGRKRTKSSSEDSEQKWSFLQRSRVHLFIDDYLTTGQPKETVIGFLALSNKMKSHTRDGISEEWKTQVSVLLGASKDMELYKAIAFSIIDHIVDGNQ